MAGAAVLAKPRLAPPPLAKAEFAMLNLNGGTLAPDAPAGSLEPGHGAAGRGGDLASRESRAAGCLGLQRAVKVRFTLKNRPSKTLAHRTGARPRRVC